MEKSYILISNTDLKRIRELCDTNNNALDVADKFSEISNILNEGTDVNATSAYDDIHTISEELKTQSQHWKTQGKDDMEGKCLESAQLLQKAAHNLLV